MRSANLPVGQFSGVIGNAFGIRAALVAANLVLTPASGSYARAMRHGGEPELDELPALDALRLGD